MGCHPGLFLRRRFGEIDQLLIGREVALLDQSGCWNREVCGAEQLVMQGVLPGGEFCYRGCGEPDQCGLRAQDRPERGDKRTPSGQQVMAFVEHQRPRAQRCRPLDQRPAIRVQQLQQGLLVTAAQHFSPDGRIRFVVDDRKGLVGQHVHRRRQVALGSTPGRGRVRRGKASIPGGGPLCLYRRVGHQHQGAPAQPARRFQSDHCLPGTWRQDQIAPVVPAGDVSVKRVQRLLLIDPPGTGEAPRFKILARLHESPP